MKWFKHMTDASDTEMIAEIEDKFGLEGYARYFKLLEIIAKQMDETGKCSVKYSWVKWQSLLKGKRNKLETFLEHLENVSGTFLKRSGNELEVKIPKLLKLRDEYSRKQAKNPEQEVEVEVDKEIDNKKYNKKEKNPPPDTYKKLSLEEIPQEIPIDLVKEFIDHRLALKKPLSQKALNLNITAAMTSGEYGFSPAHAIEHTIQSGWQKVEPKWVANAQGKGKVIPFGVATAENPFGNQYR